jgi:hypothetical protein
MPLSLALVFHFNQHTHPYVGIANQACYRGLLGVLRAHCQLKFNLHLSGTLLRALPWFDPATLDLVRSGLADGQFELLGSTYAQNVPYASDDWDNAQQMGLHRAVLEQMFGVSPTVFWNSERCWRQSLVPVIAQGGYRVTLVEDHILHAGGLDEPVPASTQHGDHSLTLVYDDTVLKHRFNYAAWFGRRAQLFRYLQHMAAAPGAERHVLAYAEDAEAHGLWGWSHGYLPHAAWAHLDALLTDLEAAGDYRLVHLSQVQPGQALGLVPDGSAQWMDASLANPAGPYHEDGYSNWFDFNARAPKLRYFRRLYGVIRGRLQSLGAARQDPGLPATNDTPAGRFYRQAIEAFCHHQYEFGCIGVGGRGYWGWEHARSAFLFVRAAELVGDPRPWQWVEDVNGDGSDEQVMCDGRQLAVLTAYGGRLLYWLDLAHGGQWAGNQLAVPAAKYEAGTHKAPPPNPAAAAAPGWLPDTFEPNPRPWQALRQKEPAPTAMGRYLPAWVFEREPPELTVYRLPEADAPLPIADAQVGIFCDVFRVDGGQPTRADEALDYRFEREGLSYLVFTVPDLVIEKQVAQVAGAVVVRYVLASRGQEPRTVSLQSQHELAPDYGAALGHGQASFEFYLHAGQHPAVRNTRTSTALALEASLAPVETACTPGLLAWLVSLRFELEVPAGGETMVELRLARYAGEPDR